MDHLQKIKKEYKQTEDSRYVYKNEIDKAYFQNDTVYGEFKDLAERTAVDKVLRNKAFNIAKDPTYDGYQRGLASIVYKFYDKKTAGSGIKSMQQNEQLAEEIYKPIIRKFKKRKVYSAFKDNIWGADLADMQLISKFSKGFRFLLCIIHIFSKNAWVVPLKDKNGVSIVNAFPSILKNSMELHGFYNNLFKKLLQDNDIAMYSTHNERKSVVADRFIRTIKNKIYKYMTSISKNVYIDKLDDIVNKCNNKYHRTIKIKPIDVKDNTSINIGNEVNDNDPKFKVGDHIRISKYKTIFTKGYTPNWSEGIFVIKEIKNTVPWTYVINDLNGDEIIEIFYEKKLEKINQQEFRIEKVIRKKGNKFLNLISLLVETLMSKLIYLIMQQKLI